MIVWRVFFKCFHFDSGIFRMYIMVSINNKSIILFNKLHLHILCCLMDTVAQLKIG